MKTKQSEKQVFNLTMSVISFNSDVKLTFRVFLVLNNNAFSLTFESLTGWDILCRKSYCL